MTQRTGVAAPSDRSAEHGPAPSVHELLLGLAGRVDDDLLAWARELLAVGEEGQAVELATAALAAERAVLPPPLRAALVAAGRDAHVDLDVDRALPPARPEEGTPHRFDAAAAPGEAVVAALTALPARRLAGCALHLTWRCTPAGAAPGPLPRAVVLVEAEPDRSADVLAYLLATELDRAGVAASVEVFTAGAPLPAYHVAALRGAREVGRRVGPPAPPVLEAPRAAPPDVPMTGRRRRPEPPPAVLLGPETAPNTDPFHGPIDAPLLAPLLEPPGLPERTGSHPARAKSVEPEPSAPADPPGPAPADVPEEWEREWRTGEWAMPPPARPGSPADRTAASGVPGVRPAPAPEGGSPLPRRAERSGQEPAPARLDTPPPPDGVSLFESPTTRVGPGSPTPDHPATPPGAGRRPVSFDDDPLFGPAPDVPLFDEPPAQRRPARGPEQGPAAPPTAPPRADGPGERPSGVELPRGGRRRRPDEPAVEQPPHPSEPLPATDAGGPPADREPAALLNGTERDLLAQLQAELASRDRRPRPYRRAGQNGSPVNGHGRQGTDGGGPADLGS